MKITKWVDMGAEVEIEIGADDIAVALSEAFAAKNQVLEEAVNIHDVLRAINNISQFLNGFTDEDILRLNDKQRALVSGFLFAASVRFGVAGVQTPADAEEPTT